MILKKDFKFIDLFAGIGGFHCAMKKYSQQAQCVFACEINEKARNVYETNFNMEVFGDIKEATQEDISTKVDVVCGGFPCQTFSKAGMQQGFGDPRGTLFKEIIRLIEKDDKKEQPKILILENVRNLISHDNGVTWNTIKQSLEKINYNVISIPLVVGPKDFGIPQLRERAIILAVRDDIYSGEIDIKIEKKKNNSLHLYDYLRLSKNPKTTISKVEEQVLDAWDDFIKNINKKILGFPIWSDEFGKNYDISDLPDWKQSFIEKNRDLYSQNKSFIDVWYKKHNIGKFIPTYRKFEWQAGDKMNSIYDGIIQFRPSGVRVKRATEFPTLVAMVQTPILGKYKRRITVKEAAQLQSFPDNYEFNERDFDAYMQLGNAVNVDVIFNVFKLFIDFLEERGC